MVHRFLVSDFNLEAIFNFNFNFILKLYNIEVEVEDGLQIKIGDQKSMYHRGGCMPKVVLDFRLGTIYMVNSRISRIKVPNALMISAFVRLELAYLGVVHI